MSEIEEHVENYYSKLTENCSQNKFQKNINYSAQEKLDILENKTAKNIQENEDQEQSKTACGWGKFTPAWLQRFGRIEAFLPVACCLVFVQGVVVSGFVSVILSTVEKRFDMSSVQSGIVTVGYDLGAIICLIPVSYFGGLGHKPKWIAIGALVMSTGSFVFALPHFLVGPYSFVATEDETVLCSRANQTTDCLWDRDSKKTGNSNYMYLMFFGHMLHGIGGIPIYTLCVTYIDENSEKKATPLYLAIYYSMALVGPAVGYIVGGHFLKIFVDFGSRTSLSPTHHQWVGAWWLGFLLSGCLFLIISIPISAFPNEMPNKKFLDTIRSESDDIYNDDIKADVDKTHFFKSLKVIFTNPIFAFINISCAAEGALAGGFVSFAPKFVESSFNLTPSWAAQLIGMVTIPSGGLGIVLGGFLVKKFNMDGVSSLRFVLILISVGILLTSTLLMRCEDLKYAGINSPYEDDLQVTEPVNISLEVPCNRHCGCSHFDLDLICGSDDMTYLSPCHAGCMSYDTFKCDEGASVKYYKGCTCVEERMTGRNKSSYERVNNYNNNQTYSAVQGKCKNKCNLLGLFMPFYSLFIFITFICCTPVLTATLRCVPKSQKSLALGCQWLAARLLGMIPAPIIFGIIIDKTCLLWQKMKCTDSEGSCLLYTSQKMGLYMFGVVFCYKSISFVFLAIAYVLFRKKVALSVGSMSKAS